MVQLVEGHIIDNLFLFILIGILYYSIQKAKTELPFIRKMVALEAIDEAVSRAVEMDRPVHFTQGCSLESLYSAEGPQIVAGLDVLSHIATTSANLGAKLIASVGQPDAYVPTVERIREAFQAADQIDEYDQNVQVIFQGSTQQSYAAATIGTIRANQIAANIMVGPIYAESLMFLYSGHDVGAIQIGGTAFLHQQAFFAAICDYMLIGEEIYAAGAYLSKDPEQLGSIYGEDLGKYFAIVLLILAILSAMANFSGFVDILSM